LSLSLSKDKRSGSLNKSHRRAALAIRYAGALAAGDLGKLAAENSNKTT